LDLRLSWSSQFTAEKTKAPGVGSNEPHGSPRTGASRRRRKRRRLRKIIPARRAAQPERTRRPHDGDPAGHLPPDRRPVSPSAARRAPITETNAMRLTAALTLSEGYLRADRPRPREILRCVSRDDENLLRRAEA